MILRQRRGLSVLIVSIALALAGGFTGAIRLSAQSWIGTAGLGVQVKDGKGRAVADAIVEVLYRGPVASRDDRGGPAARRTDSKGQASFSGLAEGTWSLEVSHPDHLSFVATLSLARGKKPVAVTSFLEASGAGRNPIRIKLGKGKGRELGTPIQMARPPRPRPSPRPAAPAPTPTVEEAAPAVSEPAEEAVPAGDEAPAATGSDAEPTEMVPAPPALPNPQPAPVDVAPPAEVPEAVSAEEPPAQSPDESAGQPEEAPEMPVEAPPEEPAPQAPATPDSADDVAAPQEAIEPPSPLVTREPEPAGREETPAPVPATAEEPDAAAPPAAAPIEDSPAEEPAMEEPAAETPPAPQSVAGAEPSVEPPAESEADAADALTEEAEGAEEASAAQTPTAELPSVDQTAPAAPPSTSPAPGPPSAPPMEEPEEAAPSPESVVAEPSADVPVPSEAAESPEAEAHVPAPEVLPPPVSDRRALRSFRERTCFECKPGEWAVGDAARVAGGASGACPGDALSRGEKAAEILAGALGDDLRSYAGSALSDEVLQRLDAETRARFDSPAGSLLAESSACRLFIVSMPDGSRHSGFRYEALEGGQEETDCLGDQPCLIGDSRWLSSPGIERSSGATFLWAVFENGAPRERVARFTGYFSTPGGWRP